VKFSSPGPKYVHSRSNALCTALDPFQASWLRLDAPNVILLPPVRPKSRFAYPLHPLELDAAGFAHLYRGACWVEEVLGIFLWARLNLCFIRHLVALGWSRSSIGSSG
jgi:hypothetical protein